MKSKTGNIIGILLILCLGFLFHVKYLNEFPSHVHAWAQSDRYALAQGFVNNKLNFFKPETYVYNKQFPDNWKVPKEETITAVDFPLHDYIPAVFMKLTGVNSPWIFRLYVLIYSFTGLFFLFRLSLLLTGDVFRSLLVIMFGATSPVFVYYQGGFLPSIPSLANAFIGIYLFVSYLKSGRRRFFSLAILFLTLAALSRTTFVIPLLAVVGYEFLRFLRKRIAFRELLLDAIPVLISFLFLLAYYFYNAALREKYGSIFLSELMPAEDLRQVVDILLKVKEKWLYQYFSVFHYLAIILVLGIVVYAAVKRKPAISSEIREVAILTGIIFLGSFAFLLAMMRQFPAHDYYFLDTFYLPAVLLFMLILSAIPAGTFRSKRYIIYAASLILSALMIYKAMDKQLTRHIPAAWNRSTATIRNYSGSDEILDSLGIAEDARMLVLDAYAPNIPFILMNRKGYAVMSTRKENIEEALTWDFDYICMQNEFFLSDIYTVYPEIINRTAKIWDDGSLTICKLRKEDVPVTLDEYLGLSGRLPVFEEYVSFDTIIPDKWSKVRPTDIHAYSGSQAGMLTGDMTYGITYKSADVKALEERGRLMKFQSYFLKDSINQVDLIVSLTDKGENVYYKSYDLNKILTGKNSWEQVNLLFQVPQVSSEDYEFALYLWNRGGSELYMDDFGFKLY